MVQNLKQISSEHLPHISLVLRILLALIDRQQHAYGLIQEVNQHPEETMKVSPGTVYVTIRRLLREELIAVVRDRLEPQDGDRWEYLKLTDDGRQVALAELERLTQLSGEADASELVTAFKNG